MSNQIRVAIPDPSTQPESLRQAIIGLKQAVEVLTAQRGPNRLSAAVTWQDLVDLELIAADQVP